MACALILYHNNIRNMMVEHGTPHSSQSQNKQYSLFIIIPYHSISNFVERQYENRAGNLVNSEIKYTLNIGLQNTFFTFRPPTLRNLIS